MDTSQLEGQQRLFRLAVDTILVTVNFVPGEGWRLTFAVRRQDEVWDGVRPSYYEWLQTEEMYDVVCAELATALGL